MELKDAKVGTKVRLSFRRKVVGEIIATDTAYSPKNPNLVLVEWEDNNINKQHVRDLEIHKPLELDFSLLEEKLKTLVSVAKEVNNLTKGQTDLRQLADDGKIDLYALLAEINKAGWSTSSIGC